VPVALISAWAIVASLVFSETTVQNLALASSLAIAGLAIVGLTAHEVSHPRPVKAVRDPSSETDSSTEREGRLAAAEPPSTGRQRGNARLLTSRCRATADTDRRAHRWSCQP
jgi:hypothetical protein